MMSQDTMTAMIVAGGRSNRLGTDKAFLKIGHTSIIETLLLTLKPFFKEILIVVNNTLPFERFASSALIVRDIIPDKGPLGGIYTGIYSATHQHSLVVACDMPFIKLSLVKYLMDCANGYDVIIPKVGNDFHPLFGVYSKNCIPVMEKMLGQGKLAISNIFPELKTRFISGEEISKFDDNLSSLININTKEDIIKAKVLQENL